MGIRNLIVFLFIAVSALGQQDTLVVAKRQLADSLYGLLNTSNIPTGRLFNRQFMSVEESTLFHFSDTVNKDTINSDYIYNCLYELKDMALNPEMETDAWNLFDSVQVFCNTEEFDNDRVIIPLTYVDKRYNYLDDSAALASGLVYLNSANQMDESNNTLIRPFAEKRVKLAGPLYNFMSADVFYFYVKREWLVVDSIDQVDHFSVGIGDYWYDVPFDTYVPVEAPDEIRFGFKIRVYLKQAEVIQAKSIQDVVIEFLSEYSNLTPIDNPVSKKICDEDSTISHGKDKLQWCLVHGCYRRFKEADKPFILLTGYRPPIVSQSFNKTYETYSTYHDALLEILRNNAFDVYLVRFNIFSRPEDHGLIQSASLLKDFIHYVNTRKAGASTLGAYNENVILAASMSCDVARLTLLMMEQEHEQGASHHHTRLMISYDGNFYGANLPLAYQAEIYSDQAFHKPVQVSPTLMLFMYSSMRQKATKELLTYHIASGDENPFANPWVNINTVPQMNTHRATYLSVLHTFDNSIYTTPMPQKMRHIAVSLGKISGTDNEDSPPGIEFNSPGESWIDVNFLLEKYLFRAAKYSPPGSYTKIFHRNSLIGTSWINLFTPIFWVQHKLSVSQMQEVDNAGGSYMGNLGNIMALTNFSLFGIGTLKEHFSHKSVVTALALNPNLWPGDGSLRVNVQDLGLMYNKWDIVNIPQSNHIGYPHLGHPADYRQLLPFDAIYIDNNINEHINLKDDNGNDADSLRDFLLNEIEPWYLGLQNFEMGGQARPDYLYKARRRAKISILVGKHVTPSAPDGWYRVLPNADLILNAGEFIELTDGFETELGAQFTAEIVYEQCNPDQLIQSDLPEEQNSGTFDQSSDDTDVKNWGNKWLDPMPKLYPNPTRGGFTVVAAEKMEQVRCVNALGIRIFQEVVDQNQWTSEYPLLPGTYLVSFLIGGQWYQQKLVVL